MYEKGELNEIKYSFHFENEEVVKIYFSILRKE